jgi:hypothetical protein
MSLHLELYTLIRKLHRGNFPINLSLSKNLATSLRFYISDYASIIANPKYVTYMVSATSNMGLGLFPTA